MKHYNMEHWKITDAYISKFREQAEEIKRKAKRELGQKHRHIQILMEHEGEDCNFYEIWMEGYLCTGMEGVPEKARFLAWMPGTDFYDACCNYNRVMTEPTDNEPYVSLHPDTRTASIWGCSLFDNRVDAQKAFG